ncbi:MAG: methyltransferase domain-containing protein [Geminicoccales bacterium]
MLQNLKQKSASARPTKAGCPACLGSETVDFFSVDNQPVNVGVFYDTYLDAQSAPRGNITLAYCMSCGFVHNREFDTSKNLFEPGYEVALHHSATFRKFISGVAERLIDRFELNGKRVVEIGCGDAFFLRTLAALGKNDCIGIDPTVAVEGAQAIEQGSLRLIRDYFGAAHQDHAADFVCCLSVFEDIPRPAPFLAAVRALTSHHNASVYFEVFNAWRAFQEQEVWSVHYEQCNYFGMDSLKKVFLRHGFSVEQIATCYEGDQYLFVEASPSKPALKKPANEVRANMPDLLLSFNQAFSDRLHLWSDRLSQYCRNDERVVVWGSGGKGITFLNSLPGADSIRYVVEINPDKQGKFVPGTGQRIVPPEFLAEYQPHKIIITNVLYEAEMRKQAQDLGVHAEFLIA